MTDSQGRQGGSSDIRIVGVSGDSTCLTGSLPTSTQSPPGSSQSAPSTTSLQSQASSTSAGSTSGSASNGISIAVIAGSVSGGLLCLAVVITLFLLFTKRKRDAAGGTNPSSFKRHSGGMPGPGGHLTYVSGQASGGQPYGMPQNNVAPASSYHYSQISADPFSNNAFRDPRSESQYQPSSRYLPLSQFDPASQYSSSQHQFSDSTTQGEYNPYQPHPGAYHPNAQPYPPNPNYQTGNPHPIDPFPSTVPALSGTQSAPFSMQTSQSSAPSEIQSSTQQETAMAGPSNHAPSRFIIHTDIEDAPPPNEDGVVELPPQYSERQGPVVSPMLEKGIHLHP